MADTENHRFILGTNSFKRENEIHLINFSEDSNRIDQEAVFQFDNGNSEIWTMAASPYNKDVFACGSHSIKEGINYLNVFDISQVSEASKDFNKKPLKTKMTLGEQQHKSNIHSVLWEDCEPNTGMQGKELISADFEQIIVWDINKA